MRNFCVGTFLKGGMSRQAAGLNDIAFLAMLEVTCNESWQPEPAVS